MANFWCKPQPRQRGSIRTKVETDQTEVTQRLSNRNRWIRTNFPYSARADAHGVAATSEITCAGDKTGGVKNRSRYADRSSTGLPTDIVVWRQAPVQGDLERPSRPYHRRATKLGEITAIVAQDNKQMEPAQSSKTLDEVIEAFRKPQCCFLMPPAEEPLVDATHIDISHESLLRGWTQLTGKPGQEGWIAEEDRDGRTYRGLLEAAENDFKLSMRNAHQRQKWWEVRPTGMGRTLAKVDI